MGQASYQLSLRCLQNTEISWKGARRPRPDLKVIGETNTLGIQRFQGDIDGLVFASQAMTTGGTGAIHTICPIEVIWKETRPSLNQPALSPSGLNTGEICTTASPIPGSNGVNGQWKLLTLEAICDRDSIIPLTPCTPVDFYLHKISRESCKCMDWVLSQKGFEVKLDLPGVDDPLGVARVMEQGFHWFYS